MGNIWLNRNISPCLFCKSLNIWFHQFSTLVFGNCSASQGCDFTIINLNLWNDAANSLLRKNSYLRSFFQVIIVNFRCHTCGNSSLHRDRWSKIWANNKNRESLLSISLMRIRWSCEINIHSSKGELAELWNPDTLSVFEGFSDVRSEGVPNEFTHLAFVLLDQHPTTIYSV